MTEYVNSPHAKSMVEYGKKHENVLVLSGDLTASCEITDFKRELPEKFVSMGMAEQNMLSWAGGLAREGFRPFIHTFSVFLYRRPFDQLSMSVAYPNLPVRLIGFLPGIMTPGGVTHQAIEDISVLRGVPNMTILETGDATEVETILDATTEIDGPIYIRMLRGRLPRLFSKSEPFQINKARIIQQGKDITIFSSGICTEEAIKAIGLLKEKGVNATLVHISTLKPFTDPTVVDVLKNSSQVISVENHSTIGGLGTALSEVIAENGLPVKISKLGIPDTYAHGAAKEYLMRKFDIDAYGIITRVEQLLNIETGITLEDVENYQFETVEEVIGERLEAL